MIESFKRITVYKICSDNMTEYVKEYMKGPGIDIPREGFRAIWHELPASYLSTIPPKFILPPEQLAELGWLGSGEHIVGDDSRYQFVLLNMKSLQTRELQEGENTYRAGVDFQTNQPVYKLRSGAIDPRKLLPAEGWEPPKEVPFRTVASREEAMKILEFRP